MCIVLEKEVAAVATLSRCPINRERHQPERDGFPEPGELVGNGSMLQNASSAALRQFQNQLGVWQCE